MYSDREASIHTYKETNMSFKSESLETSLILAELAGIKCDVGELKILLKSYAMNVLRDSRNRELERRSVIEDEGEVSHED